MTNVFLDMSVSLDGFTTAPDGGDGGLHNWYFAAADDAARTNRDVIDEVIAATGAIVMGRRSYNMADQYDGFVNNPYHVPHFVLSHTIPSQLPKGNTALTFVTDGVAHVLAQAKAAAGTRDVCVSGGANFAQQCLDAELLDEIQLHVVPVLLGGGIRLFDQRHGKTIKLEMTRLLESPSVIHLRYRVVK